MHAHTAKSLQHSTVKGKEDFHKKANQHEKKISEIEKQSPHIWNAPLLSPSAWVGFLVSLCSGTRQRNQRQLGYRQEYWFHYSALTPPTYLTNVRAASHLLSLQDCCRHTRWAANRRNKKRGEKARVLVCLLTHTTPEMLTKTLYHSHSHTHTERCVHRHLSSLSAHPFSPPPSHPHPSIYLFLSRFPRLY